MGAQMSGSSGGCQVERGSAPGARWTLERGLVAANSSPKSLCKGLESRPEKQRDSAHAVGQALGQALGLRRPLRPPDSVDAIGGLGARRRPGACPTGVFRHILGTSCPRIGGCRIVSKTGVQRACKSLSENGGTDECVRHVRLNDLWSFYFVTS